MNDTILVAIITLAGTVFSALIASLVSSKLTVYRIDQLEKKVEKVTCVVERVAIIERDIETAFVRIDELKKDVKEVRNIAERK